MSWGSWIEPALGFGLPVVLVGPLLFRALRGKMKQGRLGRDGIETDATVVDTEPTGLSVNDQPELKFTLRYDVDGRAVTGTTTRIVDALSPGTVVKIRYDRANPTDCVLVTKEDEKPAPVPASDERKQTGATFDAPLWLFSTKSCEEWLLPRAPGRKRIVVVDFSDPYEKVAEKERSWLVDSAAFLLCETLWMRTDAPAASMVLVNLALKKLVQPRSGLAKYEDLSGLTSTLESPAVVAWGVAARDIERDGLTMKVRLSDEDTERSFTAPLADLGTTLIDWLVGRGLCARRDPPSWYALPKDAEKLPLYAMLFHNLQLMLLADAKNHALPPLDADFHEGLVDYAFDAVAELDAGEQVAVAAITTAVYARRADKLPEPMRQKALTLVDELNHEDLRRIAPRFYTALGEPARAQALIATPESSAYRTPALASAYGAWLTTIED